MEEQAVDPEDKRLAEAVRDLCLREAKEAYDDARMRGLCEEGAWECAVGALEALDVDDLVRGAKNE